MQGGNHGVQTARGLDGCDPTGTGIIQEEPAAAGPGLQQYPGPVDAHDVGRPLRHQTSAQVRTASATTTR